MIESLPKLTDGLIYCIKVDTEAIARNGKLAKNLNRTEYEPAIIVIKTDGHEVLSENNYHEVNVAGSSKIYQNDRHPGCCGSDNRRARVWVETEGPLFVI